MLILVSLAAWAIPVQMTQQGRVVDVSGVPLEGTHIFEYRIYDAETGGNVVWDEAMVEQLLNGYYSSVLGADVSSNPLDESVLSLYPLYLELQVDGGTPLPRQAIHSAPYAQIAGVAESVEGGSVSASDLTVGGVLVVDSGANWVGPPLTVDWPNLTGVPAGFFPKFEIVCSV